MKKSPVEKDLNAIIFDADNTDRVSDDYPKLVIGQMTKQIEERLNSLRYFSPLLLTIVTSILAYLMTKSFTKDMSVFVFVTVGYLLLCFLFIVIAYFPRKNYKSILPPKTLLDDFDPCNITSYIGISDLEFISKLQNFIGKRLSCEELLLAHFLKQKINEFAYKRAFLSVSYFIIIFGTVLMGISCVCIAFSDIFQFQ